MNRRDALLSLLVFGAAAGSPLVGAQQPSKMRRIGVLLGYAESDAEAQARLAAFKEALAALGWSEGRNLQIDIRWAEADLGRASAFARELVALKPEVILSNTTPVTAAVQRETRTIPIVFTVVSDPVGSGFVKTLSQPGGNITGFINLESSLVEKWLQLLKEIAPRVSHVGVMFNPKTAPYIEYYLRPLDAVAPKQGVKVFKAAVASEADIEKTIAGLGRQPGGALLVMTDSFMTVNRRLIIALAARHKVPAIYFVSNMAVEGGLIAYGVDYLELFRQAAPYIDRILRGAKAADLPVVQPTKFELVINRKTARALGLTLTNELVLRADRVIE